MPKLSGLRNSMKSFTRNVSRKFGGKGGDRKSLLKKNSSKSFSDITKTSSKSNNPFNDLAKSSNNKRGIGQRAADYKSKGRSVQNYIPSGPSVKAPSKLQRVNDKKPSRSTLLNGRNNLKKTGRDATSNLEKPIQHEDFMNESAEYRRKVIGQQKREARQKAGAESFRNNLDKISASQTSRYQDVKKNLGKRGRAQMDTLRRGGGGGGMDPTLMYMMMQSKQDADAAEEERKQARKQAAEDKAVETRQNFFG